MGYNSIISEAPYWFAWHSVKGNHGNRCLLTQRKQHDTGKLGASVWRHGLPDDDADQMKRPPPVYDREDRDKHRGPGPGWTFSVHCLGVYHTFIWLPKTPILVTNLTKRISFLVHSARLLLFTIKILQFLLSTRVILNITKVYFNMLFELY